MNLLRKILMSMVMGLAAIAPLCHAPTANGDVFPRSARYYAVYYRPTVDHPWSYYYSTYNAADAERYADWIRTAYRYEAFVYAVR